MKNNKVYNFKIFKFKDEINDLNDCFRNDIPSNKKEIKFDDNIDAKGYLWFYENFNKPKWFDFIELFDSDIVEKCNKNNKSFSCCFAIRVDEKIFGLSFGYGFHYFDNIENDNFGFKVGLNSIQNFLQVNSTKIQDNVKNKNTTIAKSNSIKEFDIDENGDLFCDFKGVLKDEYKDVISNSIKCYNDSVLIGFNSEKNVNDFENLLREILKLYNSEAYKQDYPWVDNMKIVKDKIILEQVKNEILSLYNSGDSSKLQLMYPEINYGECIQFYYNKDTENIYNDIDIIDLYRYRESLIIKDLNDFKNYYIYNADNNQKISNIYKIITAEININNKVYVMYLGNIFEIKSNFNKKINDNFKKYIKNDIDFIEYNHDIKNADGKYIHSENEYNKDLAQQRSWKLLDRKKTKKYQFEICDILKENEFFIHVKYYNNSSTFSHLFFQGCNSAEILKTDQDKLLQINNDSELQKDGEFNIDKNKINVYFAIIKDKNSREDIPFLVLSTISLN